MRFKYINQGRRPLRLGLPLSDTTLLYTHTGAAADCCVAWVEPLEAQDALAQARCRRDVGEMWARCGRDTGEMWARLGFQAHEDLGGVPVHVAEDEGGGGARRGQVGDGAHEHLVGGTARAGVRVRG